MRRWRMPHLQHSRIDDFCSLLFRSCFFTFIALLFPRHRFPCDSLHSRLCPADTPDVWWKKRETERERENNSKKRQTLHVLSGESLREKSATLGLLYDYGITRVKGLCNTACAIIRDNHRKMQNSCSQLHERVERVESLARRPRRKFDEIKFPR